MNVFSYIRVSGRGQLSGEGPDRQREAVKAFCDANRINCAGEFFEQGVSGTVDALDRPALVECLETIECRRLNGEEIDGIVVERADRLARDLMVGEFLLIECRKRNVKVFAADRGQVVDLANDDGDPTRTLIRQVVAAVAQWEKSQTVAKLAKARAAIRRKTGRCEGQKPFGTRPGEQGILNFLRAHYAPDVHMNTMTRCLNEAGFKTRRGTEYTRRYTSKLVGKLKLKGLI